jgi:hypothetical protein
MWSKVGGLPKKARNKKMTARPAALIPRIVEPIDGWGTEAAARGLGLFV